MIKVIHEKPIRRTVYAIECNHCLSIMQGEKEDVVWDQSIISYYATCAVCGRSVYENYIHARTELVDSISGQVISSDDPERIIEARKLILR
jgi:hypothetical protein